MSTHGFDLIATREIAEYKSKVDMYRHKKTGAELLSIQNDDENKFFSITFRTPPSDPTGVAHILEHAVLAGSEKYPLKEPFVELLKGSLASFVNAMTFEDKTAYPVASQNLQDFYNLIDVYIDAVFHPLLYERIFEQEGWHYELEDLEQPLRYKGVVFNEMKGAMANPDNVLLKEILKSLFPNTPYAHASGGVPEAIPDLTYAQFKAFFDTNYHPSNARIFFYGDDPPEERLRLIHEYLKDYDPAAENPAIPLQKAFDKPSSVTTPFIVSEGDDSAKSLLTVNWMLPENNNAELAMAYILLAHVLMGTPASPLRRALIESGLGEEVIGSGYDPSFGLFTSLRQLFFTCGLRGVQTEDVDKVEELILATLAIIADDGLEKAMIEATMNTIEFQLRENNFGHFPRGLILMVRALSTWLHNDDPFAPLDFAPPLDAIKRRLAAGEPIFETMVRQHMLDNPHRTTVHLVPDPALQAKQDESERDRLDKVRSSFSERDLQGIIESTKKLKDFQETPNNPETLALLPTLNLSDLDTEERRIPLAESESSGVKILYHDLPTYGIAYFDLGFNLHALPPDHLPYIPLLGRAFTEMGTEKENYIQLAQRIGRTTGGIQTETFTSMMLNRDDDAAWLFLRGKATAERTDELLSIFQDILSGVCLDNRERFRQIVLEEKAQVETELAQLGHQVVYRRLQSGLHLAGWADEQMNGVEYLFHIRELADQIEKNWPDVLQTLETIRHSLINREGMICNVTIDGEQWLTVKPALEAFLAMIPSKGISLHEWAPELSADNEGLIIPVTVNYVGKATDIYRLGHKLHGSYPVVAGYLKTTWLWDMVRLQGGAYGAFSILDNLSGVFAYLSYRDPNILKTLSIFDESGDYLRKLQLSDQELTKSIIGAIGRRDQYLLPDAKGFTSLIRYLSGVSDEYRQRLRDEVLATTASDFVSFGDALDSVALAGRVIVLGSERAIKETDAEMGEDWLQLIPVL
ncbi:MAG: insulinase family protein [Anaerolineales bacterium]